MSPLEVLSLEQVFRELVSQVAPDVISHLVKENGFVPVFVDGTGIEVSGRYFEEACKGYAGEDQYWLHGVFLGGLWVSGRLRPGNYRVTGDWQEQLDRDVLPLLEGRDVPV